jgi:hypothetical protein
MIRSLSTVKALLETNQRAVNTPGLRGEASQLRELATSMLHMFDKVVEPYLFGALEVALGDYAVAKEHLKKEEEVVEEIVEEEVVEEEEEEKETTEESNAAAPVDADTDLPAEEPTATEAEVVEEAPPAAVEETPVSPPADDTAAAATADGWDDF